MAEENIDVTPKAVLSIEPPPEEATPGTRAEAEPSPTDRPESAPDGADPVAEAAGPDGPGDGLAESGDGVAPGAAETLRPDGPGDGLAAAVIAPPPSGPVRFERLVQRTKALATEVRAAADRSKYGKRVQKLIEEVAAAAALGDTAPLVSTLEELAAEVSRHVGEAEKRHEAAKAAILEEARRMLEPASWKEAGPAMQGLFEKWRLVGSAGRPRDGELWEEFRKLRQEFFEKKRKFFEEREERRHSSHEAKERIVAEARVVSETAEDFREGTARFQQLLNEWKAAGTAGREQDDKLWEEFQVSRESFFARRDAFLRERDGVRNEAREKKRKLVEEAKKLATSEELQKTSDRFRKLMEEWRAAGSAGKDHDEALWGELHAARQSFQERFSRFREEREELRRKAEARKEELVRLAQELVSVSSWKDGSEQARDLREAWKLAGWAGKEAEQALWERFNHNLKDFFAKRNHFYRERDGQWEGNRRRKESFCERAEALVVFPDAFEAATEARKLSQDWREVGPCRKEEGDALWARFRGALDKVFARLDEEREKKKGARPPRQP